MARWRYLISLEDLIFLTEIDYKAKKYKIVIGHQVINETNYNKQHKNKVVLMLEMFH